MTGYEFRFQPLLEHTEQREERKTLELAALTAEERLARDALATLRAELERQLRDIEATYGDAFDPRQYQQAVAYLDHLAHSIDRQSALLAEVSGRVLESRDQLLDILREKRSLERLREREATEEALEDDRREARTVDEMTTARFARRTAGGA